MVMLTERRATDDRAHIVLLIVPESVCHSTQIISGKIGRTASQEVTLELLKSKCIPVLIYGLECFSLPKSDLKSLDFAVIRFLMKVFRTSVLRK